MRQRTGRSSLRHDVVTQFRIGDSTACHCGTSPMTVEHFLQDCQTRQNLRAETWPAADTAVRGEKIVRPCGEPPACSSMRPSYRRSCLSERRRRRRVWSPRRGRHQTTPVLPVCYKLHRLARPPSLSLPPPSLTPPYLSLPPFSISRQRSSDLLHVSLRFSPPSLSFPPSQSPPLSL